LREDYRLGLIALELKGGVARRRERRRPAERKIQERTEMIFAPLSFRFSCDVTNLAVQGRGLSLSRLSAFRRIPDPKSGLFAP
jgi:hypothetical protein